MRLLLWEGILVLIQHLVGIDFSTFVTRFYYLGRIKIYDRMRLIFFISIRRIDDDQIAIAALLPLEDRAGSGRSLILKMNLLASVLVDLVI